jgi:hypothetical protein
MHPEYQRTFLGKVIRLINSVGANDRCAVNILMTTHSPFILSDVLSNNIMYLENGDIKPVELIRNPFAANVNDILKQDFFMQKGFMGSIAQKRIGSLVTFLSNPPKQDHTYDLTLAPLLIDEVGDPFLKLQLQLLYDKYMHKNYPNYER